MANRTAIVIIDGEDKPLPSGDTLVDAGGAPVGGAPADDSITNTKLANMAQATIKGRQAGSGTGDPEDLTAAQVKTILSLTKSDVGLGSLDNTSDADKPVSTATQTALDGKLSLSGGTMVGDLTLAGDPDSSLKAATKQYVDNARLGMAAKQNVRAATTAAATLATDFENGDTIDGVTLATGDRILIKNQAAGAENGIYTVNASGAPTRATDFDAAAEITNGAFVFVEEGTVNADTGWMLTNDGAITLGTTALTFTQFDGGRVTAGTGLTKSGNTIGLDFNSAAIVTAAEGIAGNDNDTTLPTSAAVKDYADTKRQLIPLRKTFYLDGQNQLTGANVMDVTVPFAGYIVAASAKAKSARTAGTLSLEPHKNGTGLTPTDLDLQLNASETTKDYATVNYGTTNYDVAAGDTVGFLATTSSFTPLANAIELLLIIEKS